MTQERVPALSVRGLSTSFLRRHGSTSIISDVSFDVHAGQTVAVVGESGAGKSITAMSVMRLLDPHSCSISGSVRLDGREILDLPEQEMRKVRGNEMSMIFQEPMTHLNPVLTIGAQISESLTYHRGMGVEAARAEAVRLLERVHIPNAVGRLDAYPHNFSGGMRQRVMIAMALACQPKLLLADEPTTALDVTVQAQILQLIRELQDEMGMAVLFITHDMGVVAEISDRTIVMKDGEVVETADTQTLFRHQNHPYSRALLAVVPKLGSMTGLDRPLRFPIIDSANLEIKQPPATASPIPQGARPILEVNNLTARFDFQSGMFGRVFSRVHAVENVSFSIQPGETLALVGESGCGKSTIGKAIMQLVRPISGSILMNGKDISSLNREEMSRLRRSVQMIFQDPMASLNPRKSIGTSLEMPFLAHNLGSRKDAREKSAELMKRVGLSAEMLRRYPHEFSGGQRQRICIARALMLDPKLIVADECVSALDVSIKAQIVNLLMDLQESLNLAYLFISHDMAVVDRISHRVNVMYLGELVEHGPREAVFVSPQHAYTKKLIESVPVPDPTQRRNKSSLSYDEIKSAVRSADYVPEKRHYVEVSDGHFVSA